MTKKIGVKTLMGMKSAESVLKKKEFKDLISGIPDGHPLIADIEAMKATVGDDLSDLPESHPLMVQLRQAKARYDEINTAKEENEEEGQEPQKPANLKKARRLDKIAERRQERLDSEQMSSVHRQAASAVNAEVDKILESLKKTYKTLGENEEVLNRDQMTRMRVNRLKRFLVAVERGVSENKLNKVMTNVS